MQNDVYPRFLKSDHYQQMISKGIEMEEAGRGFFSRLQRKKIDSVVKQDATGISPCLPQRYAKRQVQAVFLAHVLKFTTLHSRVNNVLCVN